MNVQWQVTLSKAQAGANIRLVGQSLGGGDAAVAAALTGLQADVFDPAPFAAQIQDEAIRMAAQSVGYTGSLTALVPSVGAGGRTTVGAFIQRTYGANAYAKFYNAYETLVAKGTAQIKAYRVTGEALSADDWLGYIIQHNSQQIAYASPTFYEVGQSTFSFGDSIALHSSTLIALVAATGGTGNGFAKLLAGDATLFDAFVGNSQGNSGAESNNRSDDANAAGSSAISVRGADPGILERALLKTAGSQSDFYTYFCNVFAKLEAGVTGTKRQAANDPNELTLQTAFERLALDVFRDKVAGTSTISAADSKGLLGAVGGSGINPLSNAIVIHKSDITATASDELDPVSGLQFGETDVDKIVWNDLRSALGSDQLTEQVLNKRHDKIFGAQISSVGPQELGTIASSPGQGLAWTVAVAQAGSAAGSFKFDPTDTSTGARSGDANQNLLIFGGGGSNDIKGGTGNDIIITGDGTTTIESSSDNAIIIAGKGTTTVNAGNGSNTIVGGTGALTVNVLTAMSAAPASPTSETIIGGSGNCNFNIDCSVKTGPTNLLIEGGTGANAFNISNYDRQTMSDPNSPTNGLPSNNGNPADVPSSFFVMWGGGGQTTYNITTSGDTPKALGQCTTNILDVKAAGLTRANFSQIDVQKLKQYLLSSNAYLYNMYPIGNTFPFSGIIFRQAGDTIPNNYGTGPIVDGSATGFNGPITVDITQFLKSPSAIDPVLGTGGTNYFTSSSSDVTLDFGLGNNTVWHGGDTFGETFTYARNDGNEVVDAFTSGGSSDVLQLTNLKASDVSLAVTDGVNLLVTDKVTGQTIRVLNQYVDSTGRYGLKTLTFSDGTSMNLGTPGSIQLVKGASGYLYDPVSNASVSLKGGLYVAHAKGEAGQTYVYHNGDGSSVINAVSPSTSSDILSFADLTKAQVTLTRVGSDLLIKVNSNSDVLRIKNQFVGGAYGVASIAFSDGTTLSAAQAASTVPTGNDPSTYVTTLASNATITLTSADQTFTHAPGASGETYVYAKANGNETLDLQTAAGSSDVLKFSDLRSSDVTATIVDGYNLRLTINATGKSITVFNEFLGTGGTFGLANVTFQDVSLNRAALLTSSTLTAPVGATYLYDPLSGTTVKAGAGDQYITHSQGETNQTYLYAKGDGNDVISAVTPGGSSDILKFTDMNATDVILAKAGNDLLVTTITNGQVIRVVNQFGDSVGTYGVSSVAFANGRTFSRSNIAAIAAGNTGTTYAPIIDGTVANQNVTEGNPATPFAGVTVADPNGGATETLYVSFAGGTGVLADGSGFNGLKQTGSSVYSLTGTAAQVSAELRALTFTPVGNQPNVTTTIKFSLSDFSSVGTNVTDGTTSVVDQVGAAAPIIAGTSANQSAASGTAAHPFSQAIVVDPNAGTSLTLSIQVTGGGALADGGAYTGLKTTSTPGFYTLSGTDVAITAELQAMTFTRQSAGTSQFALSVNSSAGTSAADNTTSVVVAGSGPVVPSITGTHHTSTTSEAPVTPFTGVTVADSNSGATDSLYINLYGSGTLADGAGFSGLRAGQGTGAYVLSGSSATITRELDALVFTPSSGGPNTSYDTDFTLYVASSAGTNVSDNATTVTNVDPAVAPQVSNFAGSGTTTSRTPINPFYVSISDGNVNATDTATIQVTGGGGTLTDGSAYHGLSSTGTPGLYALASASATNLANEINALTFTPANSGTSVTNAFLTVNSSAGTSTSTGALTFSGTNQSVSLNGTTTVAITDLGHALNVAIGSNAQTDTISGFGTTDTTGVIDFKNGAGGFASVSNVVAALHSDGHGGTLLNLGASGSIDFLSTPQTQLHASNFKIG